MHYNPDYELYDNTGRTTEQIHAHNLGTPTWDDQLRWVENAAEPFLKDIDLPDNGLITIAWKEQLPRAKTPAEFYAISDRVLGDGPDQALPALVEFLETAANWCEHNGQRELARDFLNADERMGPMVHQLNSLAGRAMDVACAALEETVGPDRRQAAPGQLARNTPPNPPAPLNAPKGPTR